MESPPVAPSQSPGAVSITSLPGFPPRSTFPSQVGMTPQPQGPQYAPTQPYIAANQANVVSGGACPHAYPDHNAGTSPAANHNNAGTSPAANAIDNPLREVPPGRKFGEFISPGTAPGVPALRPVSNPMVTPTVGTNIENSSVVEGPSRYENGSFFHPRSLWQDVCNDHRNYYTWPNACGYLYAIAGGSLLANTSLDDDFRDWYQRDARSTETDNFATFWKTFGEGEYVVPFFACTAVVGKALDRFPVADMVGEHGYRTTRAYLVGFPPMLFSQHLLGGSRPNEAPHGSMWRPFNDNNAVSGHSFMGAVPFITAAQMSDCWFTKASFYALSTFPAWSRINDDAHFLSQTCLGWYMAYMACSSINKTEDPTKRRCFEVFPLCEPRGVGIMAIWKR